MPDKDLIDYVDLRIGVDNDGNTVIGPQRPNASINPSPDTQGGGHSGYFSNHPIRGFSQIHASGTGWGKYGQFLIRLWYQECRMIFRCTMIHRILQVLAVY